MTINRNRKLAAAVLGAVVGSLGLLATIAPAAAGFLGDGAPADTHWGITGSVSIVADGTTPVCQQDTHWSGVECVADTHWG